MMKTKALALLMLLFLLPAFALADIPEKPDENIFVNDYTAG